MSLIISTSPDSFAFSPRINMAAFPVSEQITQQWARALATNCSCPSLKSRCELKRDGLQEAYSCESVAIEIVRWYCITALGCAMDFAFQDFGEVH